MLHSNCTQASRSVYFLLFFAFLRVNLPLGGYNRTMAGCDGSRSCSLSLLKPESRLISGVTSKSGQEPLAIYFCPHVLHCDFFWSLSHGAHYS